MLKTVTLAASLALSALGATSAQSTVTVPIVLVDDTGGFVQSVKNVFSYDFTFTLTQPGTLDASLTSAAVSNPIAFTSVTLNGIALIKDLSSNSYALPSAITAFAGPQVFHVAGKGSARAATFVGSLQFTSLVPEPAAWMMMVVGFGALGATMRRRPAAGIAANA